MKATDSFDALSPCRVWIAALLASLLNILPMLLFNAGGDLHFHLVLFECFAGQFWQGDLYPRWCFTANAGMGSPVFLFYFPLPYYIAALLYPLTFGGASLASLYTASLYLAGMVTVLACHAWLKTVTGSARALLVGILLLFMPYRMEAMLFRAGYAEIWGMAFLPLLLLALRRLGCGQPAATAALAGAIGLMLLTHIPLTIVALVLSAVYVLAVPSDARWRVLSRYALAGVWGASIAAFYLVPGVYFRRFMYATGVPEGLSPWANNFLTFQNLHEQGRVVAGDAMAMLALALLGAITLRRIRRIESPFQRREVVAWLAGSMVAALLLFPVSAPLYDALKPWSGIVFPWRMQAVFVFATAFLLAVWMQWFTGDKRLKTWKGDYGMLLALMVLLSFFMVGVRPDDAALERKILAARPVIGKMEYQTAWMDGAHFNDATIFARLDAHRPQVTVVSGKGRANVERWGWDGIVIQTDAAKQMVLRVDHAYFPVWAAEAEDGADIVLAPEEKSGLMLLTVPAGGHRVQLQYGLFNHMPIILICISVLSLKAIGACLWGLMRYPLASWALTKPRSRVSFRA